mmetsp:Transcript_26908/g.71402  ORF Transcript_26908/g.71402 Transcript_26908/m.71402 type:complete len:668 (-) Transcript_26908:358-2361(-)
MLAMAVVASLLTVLFWLSRLTLQFVSRIVGGPRGTWSAWLSHYGPGRRVLLVCRDERSSAELAASAAAQGAQIFILNAVAADPTDERSEALEVMQHQAEYDVVVVDSCLSAFPEETSKAMLLHLCTLTSPGGVLLTRDLAVLPGSTVVRLLQSLRHGLVHFLCWLLVCNIPQSGPPYDIAAWLPSDANLEARTFVGPLHEALAVRKRTQSAREAVERLRRLYGGTSMAYCTSADANRIGGVEGSIRYFFSSVFAESCCLETGYVAYVERVHLGARLRLVLMDPVCALADRHSVLMGFLEECAAVQARPIFSCVSVDWKTTLQEFGLHTTMLGGEIGINLENYSLSKDRRRYLRAAPAKGLECHTECFDLQELEELNATWVDSKACGTEVLIWTWPPSMPEMEADGNVKWSPGEVRRLFTYQDGRLVGFVCAEPYYRGDGSGEILGYGLNTIRFLPRLSPPWISDFTVATLIQSLQEEGKAKYLAFGFSPFSQVAPHSGDLAWLRIASQVAWHANLESVYPVQALARKKAHHCAGQAVRLEDRFVSADPAFAFGDTLRFLTLLFGENVSRLPEALAILACTMISKGVSRGSRCICSSIAGMSCIFTQAIAPSSLARSTTARCRGDMKTAAARCTSGPGLVKEPVRTRMHLELLKQRCARLWQLTSDLS